jgi:DNA-binding IclR family transcriptional regulator
MRAVPDTNRYSVPALERGMRILDLFGRGRTKLSGADVARELSVPRASAFRLLRTLERLGYLKRGEDGTYRVGPALLRLGFDGLAALDVTEAARDAVDRLRDRTGHAAQVAVREGRDIVVVAKAIDAQGHCAHPGLGARMPAHAAVLGRVLLCELPAAELDRLYPAPDLPTITERTPRELEALKGLLREDRARGFAVGHSFYQPGFSSLGAPIRGPDGAIVAGISVAVRAPAIEGELHDRLAREVLSAARAISNGLCPRSPPREAAARERSAQPAALAARSAARGLDATRP